MIRPRLSFSEQIVKIRPAMKGLLYRDEWLIWHADADGEPNHLTKHEETEKPELPTVSFSFSADRRISTYVPFVEASIADLIALTLEYVAGAQDDRVELLQGFRTVWEGLWQDMRLAEMEVSANPPLSGADEVETEVVELISRAFDDRVSMLPPYLKIEGIGRLYIFVTRDYKVRNRPAIFLGGLYVDKEHRGKGHGKLMMKVLISIADKLGLRMYLDAHPYEMDRSKKTGLSKDPLKEFYRSFGFRDATREMRESSGYQDMMIRNPQ